LGSAKTLIPELFGRRLSDIELGAVVGALDDSALTVDTRGRRLITSATHPQVIRQIRSIERDPDGELFLHNEEFFKRARATRDGLGLKSFGTQVLAARTLGVGYIKATIAGNLKTIDRVNGYFVWALYGFNAPLMTKI
jgi:hypothetical protein